MEKKPFAHLDEYLYEEKLDNGIKVYLYNTEKTKNFYISISVNYGANVTKYKINNKTYDVIPGSAHFLEHKVMALSENPIISKRINDLGSLANAWTNYRGTNYNIFGSINIIENLKLLLDIFYNININEKSVEEEKGIIGEEIDMYKDQINYYMTNQLFNNLFENLYIKNTVVGERETIDKITAKSLNQIYNDYYIPNNTFIIVCGNFDNNEVLETIKDYLKKIKINKKTLPKRIKDKEKDSVPIAYQEIQKELEDVKVKYAIKIPRKNFKIKSDILLKYYLGILFDSNFTPSSKLYEKYKNNNIIFNMNSGIYIVEDYVVIIISAFCKESSVFLEEISKDIKDLYIDKMTFERKKKIYLKSFITDFDNIEDIEYCICESILIDGKINYNEYNDILNMDYKILEEIKKSLCFDNISIVKTIK